MRQMSIKDKQSRSWFTHIRAIGDIYHIDLDKVLLYPWPKETWKIYVKRTVDGYWREHMAHQLSCRSTVKWLIQPPIWREGPHPLWQVCEGRTYHVSAATTRAKMLVGRYHTQLNMSIYRPGLPAVCPICSTGEDEDLVHLLASCTALDPYRSPKIKSLFEEEDLPTPTME